ncbi:SAM-dependent methyltransferase [Nocardioides aromaticivorans]|uniref:SAM-dependent methyltransferase n=1 Tax=Nocardioides aromaticivorans TaxID=200618 RepID=A0ABX7PMZ6_9ACTN|nr:class I SAM-dependent methyltransferase [Nocardioides aromaticivorans]QSR27241.1 SAM-dependent methyltransferase [Nocardioides aromaticivorans]
MGSSDSAFVGRIPEIYERLLVPLVFAEPARHLAAAVLEGDPQDVLETAAGTGVLTRALVDGGAASITATDLNEPMLAAAQALCPSERVRWEVADALALPVADASYDAVACQFGVMFFPDKVRGYAEARRVLRPGGSFHLNAWDRVEANPAWCVVSDALNAAAGEAPLLFLRRMPYGYHDPDVIGRHLEQAGFEETTVERMTGTSVADAATTATAICQGTPLRSEIEAHPVLDVEQATEIATEALLREYGDGTFEAAISWFQASAS